MRTKILTLGFFAASLLFTSCSDEDSASDSGSNYNLELSLTGLENLGDDYLYEGWVIVDGSPVSTGVFSVDDSGTLSDTEFNIDADNLAVATNFVLSIEPVVDTDPAPSATKMLIASFDGNRIWFGSPGAPPTANFEGMPELELASGWRYEGWVVVDGLPISTGTFTSFDEVDSGNEFSGTEYNMGPPVPGEDFFLNEPSGVTFPLDVRGKTAVISLEPYPDNSAAPFSIKPLLSAISDTAQTAPTEHVFGQNLSTFPAGTITRK